MKIKILIATFIAAMATFLSCNDNATQENKEHLGAGDSPSDLPTKYHNINGKKVPEAMIKPDTSIALPAGTSHENARYVPNPNGLAVEVNSPYNGNTETTYYWGPSGHGIYWGGDWSGDFWKDNGNTSADYGYSCYQDVYLNVAPITYPGGQRPQSLQARLTEQGNACASGNYYDGGYTQKWEITAFYNGVATDLGWILYAHLASGMTYSVGTVVNLNGPLKIGTAFSSGSANGCWGSCHIHIELFNHDYWACYNVNPPEINNRRIGILGGYGSTTQHCPAIAEKTNWARYATGCGRSSAYSSSYDCNKVYDGAVSGTSKWVSDGYARTSWMTLDLGTYRNISEFVIKHAGSAGEPTSSNTRSYQIQYSSVGMGGPWTTLIYANNGSQQNQNTYTVGLSARYLALLITDPGVDNYTRIVEFEVNGQ